MMGRKDKYDVPFEEDMEDYDTLDGFPEEGEADPYADPELESPRRRRRRLQAGEVRAEASSRELNEESPEPPRRRRGVWRRIGSVVTGSFLQQPMMRKAYPFLLLVALVMSLYVWNVLTIQDLYRREEALRREINDLRIRSNTITRVKMQKTRRDEILREIKKRGLPLREAVAPDTVIVAGKPAGGSDIR